MNHAQAARAIIPLPIKKPRRSGVFPWSEAVTSGSLDVRRSQALWCLLDLERHLLALGQGTETAALYCGIMDEYVLATIIRLNKAETLAFIKPLNGTGNHTNSPQNK
jgi:hypothetical protein